MSKYYGIVYKATNKINGKSYIGQTTQFLCRRIADHVSKSLNDKDAYYFHKAIKKHGKDSFVWTIIGESVSREDLNNLEIEMIKKYDTFNNGYNLTLGGEGASGYKLTEEVKDKISKTLSGKNHPWYGKHHSEETKIKISKANKGRKFSKEHRKNLSDANSGEKHHNYGKHLSRETRSRMSKAQQGIKNAMYGKHHSEFTKNKMSKMRRGSNHPLYGLKHSEETRNKMSKSRLGRYLGSENPNAKKYLVITPEGEEIVVHGLTEFCRNYEKEKLSYKNLYACVHGRQTYHKGYRCRYLEDKDEI